MSAFDEVSRATVQVGYHIAPDGAGGWALTLRVAELPGGLLADYLGRTLVAVVQNSLEPGALVAPAPTSH